MGKRTPREPEARLATLFDVLRGRGWEPGRAAGWKGETLERIYRRLCQSRTTWGNLPFACVAVELLALNAPDTVRGNMYRVVSAGWLPDTGEKSYNRVQRLLNRLRLNGTVPFEWVVDNIRATVKPSSWSGLADYLVTVRDAYRKSFWPSLPEYVEVIVEKDAVAGCVAQVTREFDVPLHPIRGYNSTTFAMSMARSLARVNKPVTIYYVGDHDPSGRDLERDIRERLERFSQRSFNWVRLAVNPHHFGDYGIRPLAPKKNDSRTRKFVEQWGRDCAEVEAIPANDLRRMLREAIESHIPQAQWQRLQEIERLEKEQWQDVMARFGEPDAS
jgi:hypothetical protein